MRTITLFKRVPIHALALAATFAALPGSAQTAPTVKTLVNTQGTLVAGDVTFSNFQTPAVLPFIPPQGVEPNGDGGDLQVTVTTANGRTGLIFTLVDPVTGAPKPLAINAATGPTNFARNVTFSVKVNNPQLLLHTLDAGFGPGTTASGNTEADTQNYYLEPGTGLAGPLISNTLFLGSLTRGGIFAPEGGSLLPGGNLAAFSFGTELELSSGHGGGSRSGIASVDSFNVTFALVPADSPVPPVVVTPSFIGSNVMVGGATGSGVLKLSAPAQAGGATVALTSNNPAVASVPASVTLPQGAIDGSFPITTAAVQAGTSVGLTASVNGASVNGFVQVVPAPPLAVLGVTLTPSMLVGGTPVQGTVFLSTQPLPEPATVTLTSSNPALVTVPAAVVVPVGATSAAFSGTTQAAAAAAVVTVSASLNGGAPVSANVVVNPAPAPPSAVFTLQVQTSGKGTVAATPAGNDRAINCGNACSAQFNSGTSVTLTAVAGSGKAFAGWENDCAGSGPVCTLTITKNTSVRVDFK